MLFTLIVGITAATWVDQSSFNVIRYSDFGINSYTAVAYQYGSNHRALGYDGVKWYQGVVAAKGVVSSTSIYTASGHKHATGTSIYSRQNEK